MLHRFREHFGTAGLVVAIVALIAALGGAAIAAQGGGDKATASAKGKQGKQGKPGKPGPQGPAGPAGPKGDTGAAGAAGAKGDAGSAGNAGVVGATGAKGATGATGVNGTPGTSGATGATGATGFSGFTETLPSGQTETGTWGGIYEHGVEVFGEFGAEIVTGVSFPIPLENEISNANVKKIPINGVVPDECDNGTGVAPSALNPEADPGFLCVYVGTDFSGGIAHLPSVSKPTSSLAPGASKVGFILNEGIGPGEGGEAFLGAPYGGTFAVTAE